MKKFLFVILAALPYFSFSQDDLLKLLDEAEKTDKKKDRSLNKVTAMFKDPAIINMQTPQTTGPGALNFNISHRFGSMGEESNGGVHTLYGWDAISDVRLSFDYGITKSLQAGVGRSKRDEAIDASLKWRFLDQTLDNKIPLSICAYAIGSFTPKKQSSLYNGADTSWIANEVQNNQVFRDRFSYTTQIVFARKFAKWLSFAITPSYTHRNYVLAIANPYNGVEDENDFFSLGAGFRLKLTRSFSILADYFYTNSKYRFKNPLNPYYAPLAVGIEIETGGHVFHIDFTNATGITANNFIPSSPDSWLKGGYKLGFNISRAFPLGRKKGEKDKKPESSEKRSEPKETSPAQGNANPVNPPKTDTKKPAEKPIKSPAPVKEIYKVSAQNYVNMRTGPGIHFEVIMKIENGTSVEVIEKTNESWWKVTYMDEIGYVSPKFLAK